MIISHNLTAMNAQREYQITTGEKATPFSELCTQ